MVRKRTEMGETSQMQQNTLNEQLKQLKMVFIVDDYMMIYICGISVTCPISFLFHI